MEILNVEFLQPTCSGSLTLSHSSPSELWDRIKHLLRVGWRNLSKSAEKSSSSPRAAGVLGDGHVMCRCVSFWLWWDFVFNVTYKLTVQQCRNRDLEGRDNGQMTFLNSNSYVQNLCFFVLVWCTPKCIKK
jgi:hypothetical protein